MIEYGLLGERLEHSHSQRIHNLLAPYDYALYPMDRPQLHVLMQSRAFRGLNVTIPYKLEVLPYCDALSEQAQAVGSVNTLTFDAEGRLWGHNTDFFGFEDMARRAGISFAGRKALILGSGGASRTAQAVARSHHAAEVVVASRTGPVDYTRLRAEHGDGELIVNATPVGMYPNTGVSPILLDDFPHCQGVLDMIYNPLCTELLAQAQAQGIPHANGLWMLVAQAWRAAELFTGESIPMERALWAEQTLRRSLTQVVLIGMPGCGKTTLGRALAERLDRPFVDMDAWIEARAGMPVPQIITQQGEAAFRCLEREAAQALGKLSGQVIATGGGTVLDPQNLRALRQSGMILWVDRDLEHLAMQGRPLSKDHATLIRMAQERLPLYAAAADARVDNNGPLAASLEAMEGFFDEAVGAERAEFEPAGPSGA